MHGGRFRTSLLMQLREYRARALPLVMVALLPMGMWAASFFSSPADETVPAQMLEPYIADIGPLVWSEIPVRDDWPEFTLLMGVAWAMGAAALFSVIGSGGRDRRLVMAGFRAWEIMLARFLILLCIAIPVSLIPVVIIAGFSTLPPPNIGLVWLGSFFTAALGAAIGFTVGSLLPRPLEGTLLLLGIIGLEMMTPLSVSFRHYLPLYGPQALFLAARWTSEPNIIIHLLRSLAWAAGLFAFAIVLWTWRVRNFQTSAAPRVSAGVNRGTS
ncbi:MAG: hypothetical protein BMS9Abin28_0030 [Anaerolineae bacterium]|nr:MAG: hypothetical protein BMS9Abin28_0030 [Anaerolineae bacterium]